jgi:hypothetical protein
MKLLARAKELAKHCTLKFITRGEDFLSEKARGIHEAETSIISIGLPLTDITWQQTFLITWTRIPLCPAQACSYKRRNLSD